MARVTMAWPNGKRFEAETSDVPPHLQAAVFGPTKPTNSKVSECPLLMLESRQLLELCA